MEKNKKTWIYIYISNLGIALKKSYRYRHYDSQRW